MFQFLKVPSVQTRSRSEKIVLAGRETEVIRKPYRRRMSMTVKLNGLLRITAPVRVSMRELAGFVKSNEAWIEETLAGYQVLRSAYPKKMYAHGEEFLFLGSKLRLRIASARKASVRRVGDDIVVETPETLNREKIAKHISSFYEKHGRELITSRVEHFSKSMNLKYSKLSFRSQKTRWGSCSSKGGLSFNWRLAIAPPEVIDYVVVHELAHLVHYDHSPKFWALVETQIPEYRRTKGWLRKNQFEADFLGKQSELHAP
ncbi:MAG TPA: SprT family zinc-dependent metalloprotease [Bdellovibrionales bacterium]|nr:SprT family zinc-dependent metalloprotease [Bdellovibrionales bacterium]